MEVDNNPTKRQRLALPRLSHVPNFGTSAPSGEVQSQTGLTALLLAFLQNVLVAEEVDLSGVKDCPFQSYIPLSRKAWSKSEETKFLVVRNFYSNLIKFVVGRFVDHESGLRD